MDYPHPNLQLSDQGAVDISQAYASGIGEWDKLAITYGYAQNAECRTTLRDPTKYPMLQAHSLGLRFITDSRRSRPCHRSCCRPSMG